MQSSILHALERIDLNCYCWCYCCCAFTQEAIVFHLLEPLFFYFNFSFFFHFQEIETFIVDCNENNHYNWYSILAVSSRKNKITDIIMIWLFYLSLERQMISLFISIIFFVFLFKRKSYFSSSITFFYIYLIWFDSKNTFFFFLFRLVSSSNEIEEIKMKRKKKKRTNVVVYFSFTNDRKEH